MKNGKSRTARRERCRRRYLWAVLVMTVLSGILYLLFRQIPAFSDFFNRTVAAFVRRILAYLTNTLPFSVAEMLLIASPVLLGFLLYYGIRYRNGSLREALLYCASLLSVLAIVFQIFVLAFAPGYYTSSLDKKLSLERRDVSARELYDTALLLIEEINEVNDEVVYRADGFSLMPYGYREMNERLLSAYDVLSRKYDFIGSFYSEVKPVLLSEPMSYTHITGVYTFFTGEANINVNFPDYTIPYTAAHELAHQRGIAREDEANFVAFLVCLESECAYIRYSGLVGMYEYVMSALSRADRELYLEARGRVEERVLSEQRAYSAFFDKYRHSTVGEVSGAINNSYLQSQGTVGTASYGMVVDLAVAYFIREGQGK
ncbi:MAG: DUF3810 domain-containing protein [Clostridia bacterium]|nr:DUF3810 domain-containing protein [Clostridia bacterium]